MKEIDEKRDRGERETSDYGDINGSSTRRHTSALSERMRNVVEALDHGARIVDLKRGEAKERKRFGLQTQCHATIRTADIDAHDVSELQ